MTAFPFMGGHRRRDRVRALCSALFQAAAEATEEAVLNSLFLAVSTRGGGAQVLPALPLEPVLARLRSAGVLRD